MKHGTKKTKLMISELVDIVAENQTQVNEVKMNTLRITDDSFSHTEAHHYCWDSDCPRNNTWKQ